MLFGVKADEGIFNVDLFVVNVDNGAGGGGGGSDSKSCDFVCWLWY